MSAERANCLNHSGMEARMDALEQQNRDNYEAITGIRTMLWGVMLQGFFSLGGIAVILVQKLIP